MPTVAERAALLLLGSHPGREPHRSARTLPHALLARTGVPAPLADLALRAALEPDCDVPPSRAAARAIFGPTLLLRVAPRTLTHFRADLAPSGFGAVKQNDAFYGRGDWQRNVHPVERNGIYREMEQMLGAGGDYRSTASYRHCLQRIEDGNPVRRAGRPLATQADVDRYYEHYLALARSIEKGYRPSRETRPAHWSGGAGRSRFVSEIAAAVDEEGRLLRFAGGQHRFAIARVLGLEAVPVEVVAVHVDFVRSLVDGGPKRPREALIDWLADTRAKM